MSAEETELDEFELQANKLKKTRNTLFKQIKKFRDERDRHNEKARVNRDRAKKHQTERDKINAEIQEIKKKLDPMYNLVNEKNKEIQLTEAELREGYRGMPRKEKIQKDLQRIEWEVMTTPTNEMLGREDEMLEEASRLKKTLEEFKHIDKKEEEKMSVISDKRIVQSEINLTRDKISELAEKSQEHHEKMILFFEDASKSRKQADEAHSRYIEKIKEADDIKQDLNFLMPQIRALRDGLRASELKMAELRKMNAQQRADALKEEALKKMDKGEKLSFQDLRLIYGEDDGK